MTLTATDVRAKRFTVTRWRKGYERSEVIALLAFAATALDQLAAGQSPHPPLGGEQIPGHDVRLDRPARGLRRG